MKWKSLSGWAKTGIILGITIGVLFVASIIAGIIAFIDSPSVSNLTENASKVVDSFYSDLNSRNYDNIFLILDKDWLKSQSKENTTVFFNLINDNWGIELNHSLIGWNVNNFDIKYATNESDKGLQSDITLVYSVERVNASATETFLIRKLDKSETYFIRGYNVKPKNVE